MFRLTIALIIVALLSAFFGFGGLASGFAYLAKIVFFIAIVLLVINLVMGGYKRIDP